MIKLQIVQPIIKMLVIFSIVNMLVTLLRQLKFPRCVFSKHSLKSSKLKLSNQQQESRRKDVEVLKEDARVETSVKSKSATQRGN